MTVSSTINREQYATDGVTTAFTIHFPFFDDTDVNAVLVAGDGAVTTLALNADFTVSGGGGAGGMLVCNAAPANGGTLTLYREIPFTQEDDYVEDDPLPADTLEGGFDRAVMRDQQLKDAQGRALTFPVTVAPGVSGELPNPAPEYFLRFSADGLRIEAAPLADLGTATQATEGTAGIARIASQALTDAGANDTDFVTPLKLKNFAALAAAAAAAKVRELAIPLTSQAGAVSAGLAKRTFRLPFGAAFTPTYARLSLKTAQASGSILTIDVNAAGASIFGTNKLTVDNTEKTSVTAATAVDIAGTPIADDTEMTIDVDQVGDGSAAGAVLYLGGHL